MFILLCTAASLLKPLFPNDNSTMRSHLMHTKRGGKLQDHIPEPEFKADPSYHIKVMADPIFKLVKGTKNLHECKNMDAMRVKNIG